MLTPKYSNEKIIQIGKELLEHKKQMSHKGFLLFVEPLYRMKYENLFKWMKISEMFDGKEEFWNLPQSVLEILSRPSMPSQVVRRALEEHRDGNRVTVRKVNIWLEQFYGEVDNIYFNRLEVGDEKDRESVAT